MMVRCSFVDSFARRFENVGEPVLKREIKRNSHDKIDMQVTSKGGTTKFTLKCRRVTMHCFTAMVGLLFFRKNSENF